MKECMNQLIRATGDREHTEVRVLDPRRSSFSCLSLSLIYSLYNTMTGRRKEFLGGSWVMRQTALT